MVPPTALEIAAVRCDAVVRQYREVGGSPRLAELLTLFVGERSEELSGCRTPTLCHNDFVDGNLMVRVAPVPELCGVFDLERASWGDPLSDLALTRIHLRYHDLQLVEPLLAAYGVRDSSQRTRLDAYEAMHLMEERNWITLDRPQGWQRSIATLDESLRRLISAEPD